MPLRFEILDTEGYARVGRLETPHGAVETPAFIPVATLGAVKGLGPLELAAAGTSIMLANLYHLALRPGIETIAELGGLHTFSGWDRPILTDSGGYQIFSLAKLRKLDADGVTFRSHLDGNPVRFTPEAVVETQELLGVDIAMVLDECPPWPVTIEAAAAAAERTHRWANRSRELWSGTAGGLFGIVQGSVYRELRERALQEIVGLDFDGYAIGGVSVGEGVERARAVVEWIAPELPEARPRYLMGLGTPLDLLHAVRHGVDLFDCVLPTRNARHGILYTRRGVLRILNARFRRDAAPPDAECLCATCRSVSRAFLHHLLRSDELTGEVMATVHNLRFYLDFVADLREALKQGTFAESAVEIANRYAAGGSSEGSTRSQSVRSHPLNQGALE